MKTSTERMREALINIHNQTCVLATDLENAQITISCIEDILKEVEDLYRSPATKYSYGRIKDWALSFIVGKIIYDTETGKLNGARGLVRYTIKKTLFGKEYTIETGSVNVG